MMDYVVSKTSTIVKDKKGRILFAGTDTEAIQFAIDKIDAENNRWYNRLLKWLKLKGITIVSLSDPEYEITETLKLTSHMELRGSEQKVKKE